MSRSTEQADLREELRNNLQIGLATGIIGGGLLGFLAAAATLAASPGLLRSTGDVIRLLLGLQVVYAALCLILGLLGAGAKTLLFLFTRRRLSDTKTAAFATGVVFFLIGGLYALSWCRWHRIGDLSPDQPIGFHHLPVLLVIAAVSLLLARLMTYAFYLLIVYFKKPDRRRPGDLRKAFFILLYMAGAFAAFVAVMRLASDAPPTPRLTTEMLSPAGRRVILLGVDGTSADDLAWLREEGHVGWSARFAGGSGGPLSLQGEPVPPIAWTAVATGRDLSAHGIFDYQAQVVRGLSTPVLVGPNQLTLFDLFHTVVPFVRMTRSVPVKSYMRESKGLWNMATDAGRKVVVVNWWVSWPAERVRGVVVSDHAWLKLAGAPHGPEALSGDDRKGPTFARTAASVQPAGADAMGASSPIRPDGLPLLLERETWPSTLLIELSRFAGTDLPDSVVRRFGPAPSSRDLELFDRHGVPRDVLRADLFYAQAAAWLLGREDPDLWMLHLAGPDIVRRILSRKVSDPQMREAIRRDLLRAYWRTIDPAVMEVFKTTRPAGDSRLGSAPNADAEESSPGPVAILVAMSGYQGGSVDGGAGLVALAGAGVSEGVVQAPIRPEEVAPTVLWLMGLPTSREMDGEPRTESLTAEAAAPLDPVRWISSYGRQEATGLEGAASTLDEEMLERFRSLGYIR